MPVNRFFVPGPLMGEVSLEGTEFHHLVHVTRSRVGETVELVNGQGEVAQSTLRTVSKKSATLSIESIDLEPAPARQMILAQALPRMNRLDWLLEKGTELGVSEIWLFPGETSERGELSDHQMERLQGITISAMKQSGRLWLPKIKLLPALKQWTSWPRIALFGDLTPNCPPLARILPQLASDRDIVFFVGPESGFTPAEIALLTAHKAIGVTLNRNILRTDTAAIAALAILLHA